MTIKVSEQDYWELLEEANQNRQGSDGSNSHDIWEYPRQLGKGYLQMIELRSGLAIEIFEAEFRENLLIECQPHRATLEFVFKFSGYGEHFDGISAKPGQDYIFKRCVLKRNGSVGYRKNFGNLHSPRA